MRKRLPGFLILTALLIFSPGAALAEETLLFLGKAKIDITPPLGTPLAGYGKRHGKPSQGVHDPIYARALALSKENETFVFVSADLVLIDAKLRKAVLRKVRQQSSLPEDHILISATHTHSGPGAIGGRFWARFIMGKKQKKVFEQTASGIAQAILRASQERIPVTAEYAETRIDELLQNRMEEEKKGPYRLQALRFKKDENQIAGQFIFMPAHPTLLPASNYHFSADFPGFLNRSFESNDASVSLFINGASGDLRPRAGNFEDRFQKAEDYANQVSQKIKNLSFQPISLKGPWKTSLQKRKLPRVKIQLGFFKIPSLLGGRIFPRHSYFQTIRLGKILFFSFPGELGSDIGKSLEQQAAALGFRAFVVGYAHDYIGYVIPGGYYQDHDHYESRASFYGRKMDWFVQKTLRSQMLELRDPQESLNSQPPGIRTSRQGLPVLSLKGDAYHVGFEEGRLLKKEIRQGFDEIFSYFRRELKVPLVNRLVISFMANRAWKKLEPFVSYQEYLQMKGLADGSGISFRKIKQIHALPEIYPALCANGAYWGKATENGRLIAIRNLDWNRHMGIHRHAAVKWIEIPGKAGYANIGYYGFSGVLSGMNEHGISVGQIGATSRDETMQGTAMPFLLKRILEESSSIEDSLLILSSSPRTRGYHYLIADGKSRKAAAVETTQHHMAVFWDGDAKEKEASYAFPLENALFRGDPALDPVIRDLQTASGGEPKKKGLEMPTGSAYEIRYLKQGKLARENYGNINPETAKIMAREIAPGSNIQSVIYAYPEFYVANAKKDLRAAETNYVLFNLEELKN